jgi:transposase
MAITGTKYPAEFRRQLVELVWAGRTYRDLCREFGPTDWTIRKWVKQAERDAKHGDGGLTTNEREELVRLRRDNRQLKLEREILSKAAAWFATESTATPKRSSGS